MGSIKHKKWIVLLITIISLFAFIFISYGNSLGLDFGTVVIQGQTETEKEPKENKDFYILDTSKYKEDVMFMYTKLNQDIIEKISGNSYNEKANYPIDDLRYVKVSYIGMDANSHLGELIVHKEVAKDITEIFEELYRYKFPIEKMKLIDEYNASDEESMADNNTSALNVRDIAFSKGILSQHSFGIAIDINPIQNPYVRGSYISPKEGEIYQNRDEYQKGMILKDGVVYNAFIKRGWIWGGEWEDLKDYQHFEKAVEVECEIIEEPKDEEVLELINNGYIHAKSLFYSNKAKKVMYKNRLVQELPESVNNSSKLMASFEEYFTHDNAKIIFDKLQVFKLDNKLYKEIFEYSYNNETKYTEIKLVNISQDNTEREYEIKGAGRDEIINVKLKYVGSQGWRIDNLVLLYLIY